MDAQGISIATAVVSAAVAALGLLLNWYRREDRKEEPRSYWYFAAAAVGVVVLAVVGVVLTFRLGAGSDSPDDSPRITEAQYRAGVSSVCFDTKEKARRIEELRAQETVLGAEISIEQDAVVQVSKFQPPDTLRSAHEEMLLVWGRRISRLEILYHGLSTFNDRELDAEAAAIEKHTQELANLFKSLGDPQCIVGE